MKKLIIPILFTTFLFSCSTQKIEQTEEKIQEHNYDEISHLLINWDEILNQSESRYFVFFFGEHCLHCHNIKNEVIHIALKNEKKLYFCNDKNIVFFEGDAKGTIGAKKVENLFIVGTPSLIEITNNIVTFNVSGSNDVVEKLRK